MGDESLRSCILLHLVNTITPKSISMIWPSSCEVHTSALLGYH